MNIKFHGRGKIVAMSNCLVDFYIELVYIAIAIQFNIKAGPSWMDPSFKLGSRSRIRKRPR